MCLISWDNKNFIGIILLIGYCSLIYICQPLVFVRFIIVSEHIPKYRNTLNKWSLHLISPVFVNIFYSSVNQLNVISGVNHLSLLKKYCIQTYNFRIFWSMPKEKIS